MNKPAHLPKSLSGRTRLALPTGSSASYSAEFLQSLIYDLQREMQTIESLIAFALNDADVAVLPIDSLSRKMAVQEIFELILRRKDVMNDILNMASHCAEFTQSSEH
jgi:hypothetical protein